VFLRAAFSAEDWVKRADGIELLLAIPLDQCDTTPKID
jgi:hypothetical protein